MWLPNKKILTPDRKPNRKGGIIRSLAKSAAEVFYPDLGCGKFKKWPSPLFIPQPLRMSPGYPCCCMPSGSCNCSALTVGEHCCTPLSIKVTLSGNGISRDHGFSICILPCEDLDDVFVLSQIGTCGWFYGTGDIECIENGYEIKYGHNVSVQAFSNYMTVTAEYIAVGQYWFCWSRYTANIEYDSKCPLRGSGNLPAQYSSCCTGTNLTCSVSAIYS